MKEGWEDRKRKGKEKGQNEGKKEVWRIVTVVINQEQLKETSPDCDTEALKMEVLNN